MLPNKLISAAFMMLAGAGWLDLPLTNWNQPGGQVPRAPVAQEPQHETRAELIRRCRLTPPRSTAAERAIDAAGWIPFRNFNRQLVRRGVEIIDGMTEADGMCRPAEYNLFVFVDGRFAGTLSPTLMTSRDDGASGEARFESRAIVAEFYRYTADDPLCCPSSRVAVRYRIDRTSRGPVVVPLATTAMR